MNNHEQELNRMVSRFMAFDFTDYREIEINNGVCELLTALFGEEFYETPGILENFDAIKSDILELIARKYGFPIYAPRIYKNKTGEGFLQEFWIE